MIAYFLVKSLWIFYFHNIILKIGTETEIISLAKRAQLDVSILIKATLQQTITVAMFKVFDLTDAPVYMEMTKL